MREISHATNGPADGLTSTDIGVSEEGSSTLIDESLQLSGTGKIYTDFTWEAPATHTRGLINNNQSFSTQVQFTSASATVNEGDGTFDLTISIANEDAVNATNVEVALTSGDAADVDNYTTQTITFAAGSSSDMTITISITDDALTEPDETLSFSLQNISGGDNAQIGSPSEFDLVIEDNEIEVNFDDFTDGDFTDSPTWGGSTSGFSVISDGTIPNGNALSDGSFLASDTSQGKISLAAPSSEVNEWQFSLASPDFNPAGGNNFGVVLMASILFTGDLDSNDFTGYFLRIGTSGGTDPIELWRKTGSGEDKVGDFPSSPNLGTGALKDGLNIRVTRNASGTFELFYSTGFQYNVVPTQSAGTLTNDAYSTSSYFGVYQRFNNPSADRRVYIDNISLGDSSIDSNTLISTPTSQVTGGTITADAAINATNSVEMFRFTVEDQGTSDGLSNRNFSIQIRFREVNNTADWSQTIEGVRIIASNPDQTLAQADHTEDITDSEIVITIDDNSGGEMTIPDGTTREYTIAVFLKTNTPLIEDEIIQLAIPETPADWEVGTNSSAFNPFFTEFEGNNFTIDVIGNGLEFISDASDTNINEAMTSVEVANTDANGNVDKDYSTDISISSVGTLDGGSVSVTPINGVATFSNLTHTELGTGLTLTATASDVSDIISAAFDIRLRPELMISEIADPADHGSSNEIRYVEIYNAGVGAIDFSSEEYYLHNTSSNSSVQLTGNIGAKAYYTIALSSADFNTEYSLSADIESNIVNFNGDDVIYLSTSDTEASLFDIYGVIANSNISGQPWDYADTSAYRTIPATSQSNSTYTSSEWTIVESPTNGSEMTPGYGDNDYIYDGNWTNIGLGNPNGNSTGNQNIFIRSGTVSLTQNTSIGDLVVRSGATLILESGVKLTVMAISLMKAQLFLKVVMVLMALRF